MVVAARWLPAKTRAEALKPYAEDAQEKAWELLLQSLEERRPRPAPAEVLDNARESTPRDVRELLPHLEKRGELLADKAAAKLRERGEREAREMVAILEGQRKRIQQELGKIESPQLALDLKGLIEEEQRQLDDNAKYWRARLTSIGEELANEPARIRQSYEVLARRIEPVGIAYLWPVTG
jgi:hypothetical protein